MLKLIHSADFHLDAPFSSLPPDLARQRRAEQRTLLTRLSQLVQTENADLVLLSGDLLDSSQTYQETVQALSRTLAEIHVPVFIAPGNHDFWSSRSIYAGTHWPDNVHIFSTVSVESIELPQLNCVVHGAAFTTPHADRSPLLGFSAPQDGNTHLMVLHGEVDSRGRYGPIDSQAIAGSRLTYLALGHIHACSGLQWAGGTAWAYPGCPEGRGFDELGDKGVLSVTIDGEDVSARFVPLAGRRYQLLTVDLTGADSPQEALEEALTPDLERDCLRIRFTGFWPEPLDLNALEALAAPRCFLCALRDETRPVRDLWERTGEESLTGLFLRGLRRKLEDVSDPQERERLTLAARFGLAALEHGEDCCP